MRLGAKVKLSFIASLLKILTLRVSYHSLIKHTCYHDWTLVLRKLDRILMEIGKVVAKKREGNLKMNYPEGRAFWLKNGDFDLV